MSDDPADHLPTIMAAMSINRTYGKIAGFLVITQKPLIKTEI
jgi:DNA-binding transcriptional regulator GbsR (MarR family)